MPQEPRRVNTFLIEDAMKANLLIILPSQKFSFRLFAFIPVAVWCHLPLWCSVETAGGPSRPRMRRGSRGAVDAGEPQVHRNSADDDLRMWCTFSESFLHQLCRIKSLTLNTPWGPAVVLTFLPHFLSYHMSEQDAEPQPGLTVLLFQRWSRTCSKDDSSRRTADGFCANTDRSRLANRAGRWEASEHFQKMKTWTDAEKWEGEKEFWR